MDPMLQANFDARRRDFLAQAQAEMSRWSPSPEQRVDRKLGDQYWLSQFAAGNTLDADTLVRFLWTFNQTMYVKWDRPKLQDAVHAFRRGRHDDMDHAVDELASTLAPCTQRLDVPRRSAASLIAMFAEPGSPVFPMSKKPSRALSHRLAAAANEDDARGDALADSYPAFAAACRSVLADEQRKDDFETCVAQLDHALGGIAGPMADRAVCPLDFIARRFLDKLLWVEGSWLEGERRQRRPRRHKRRAESASADLSA